MATGGSVRSLDVEGVTAPPELRLRGFMLAVPNSEVLQDAILQLELGEVAPAFHPVSVEVLTARGKSLQIGEIFLVDLPWSAAPFFCQPITKRGFFRDAEFVQVAVGDKVGKPSKEQVFAAAEAWIAAGMDEDTEGGGARCRGARCQPTWQAPSFSDPGSGQPQEVQALLRRVAELESQLKAAPRAARSRSNPEGGRRSSTLSGPSRDSAPIRSSRDCIAGTCFGQFGAGGRGGRSSNARPRSDGPFQRGSIAADPGNATSAESADPEALAPSTKILC